MRILLFEDNPTDANLVLGELRQREVDVQSQVVSTREDFFEALSRFYPDLILANYPLSNFNGVSALQVAKTACPDTPFIFIAGPMGEEMAIELLKQGAEDYVLRENLSRLVPAIHRAIREAKERVEHRRTEEQLRERNRELYRMNQIKTDLISMVSHELRTPLSSVKEGISIVLDGLDGPVTEQQRWTLGIAKSNVDRLSRLINNILDFAKLESGKMAIIFDRADLNQVVQEAFLTLQPIIEKKGIQGLLQLPDEGLTAVCDADKIRQVIINFVDNAIKYTDPGGQIQLRLRREDHWIVFEVQDTGIGIREEDQQKIFEMFGQVASGLRGGFGVGLAVCKYIIGQHRGSIEVISEIGKGSCFRARFPDSLQKVSHAVPI